MRVVVDFDLCESNALCMQAAPEVFEVRDDDFLYVLQENPPEELRSKVEEAVRRCPKQAITLEGLRPWIPSRSSAVRSPASAPSRSFVSEGFAGTITVIGAEPHLPYDRPPLSKHVLAGAWDADRLLARRRSARRPTPWTSTGVSASQPALSTLRARRVELADGSSVAFDGLVIATGTRVRTLPGQPDLAGIHTLAHARRLPRAARGPRRHARQRVVVVGAGFIGAEVAATARKRGPRGHAARGARGPVATRAR